MIQKILNLACRIINVMLSLLPQGLKKRTDLSSLTILLSVTIALWHLYNIRSWKNPERVIVWDVISYYAYLPATFIHQDITLKFIDKGKEYPEEIYWPNYTTDNQYVIKTSMGMSYIYAPFFFIAHATVGLTDHNPSGFSAHYKYFLVMGGILYYLIGLIVLRKILLGHFNQLITSLTILTITIGTNLFYYSSTEVTMPHIYIFALTNILLLTTIKWYESPGILKAILIGILTGVISLIRPVNIIVILLFIFWDICSWNDIRSRFMLFGKHFHYLIIIAFVIFAVWMPQFLYWKAVTGHWVFFSYIGEKFFFLKPQIMDGLFGFRKGWLLYTPVMIFALAGIPILWKHKKEYFWPVLLLLIAHVYIIYSWWCWWYGGSLGSRPMIDIYGVLAIPMATFLHWTFKRKIWGRLIILTLFFLLGLKGAYFNVQYYYGAIHWDGMTKEAYIKSFFKTGIYEELDKLIQSPDYEAAKKGMEKL